MRRQEGEGQRVRHGAMRAVRGLALPGRRPRKGMKKAGARRGRERSFCRKACVREEEAAGRGVWQAEVHGRAQ